MRKQAVRLAGIPRHCATAILVVAVAVASEAQVASAEVGSPIPTVQASASDAAWLAYAPPPASPGVVCMVDSGVDPNPDTSSSVIGGVAIVPGTNTLDEAAALNPPVEPGDHPDGHGTVMAMVMAAPLNGWGMVGIAPTAVRVYNVKALPAGQVQFSAKNFYLAVEECQRLHEAAYPNMRIINLSLGGEPTPEASVLEEFKRAVTSARQAGMSVVASAGDTAGSVQFPADYGPVLAVGAADAGTGPGVLCSFASRGEGLDILAPGCDSTTSGLELAFQDTGEPAFGAGASQASAIVAPVEAAIDAYAPQLTPEQTETCLTSTEKNGELDAARAFAACGLESIVQAGEQAQPHPSVTSTAPSSTSSTTGSPSSSSSSMTHYRTGTFELRCSAPRVHAIRKGHEMQLRTRPVSGCRLQARSSVRVHDQTRWESPVSAGPNDASVRLRVRVGARIQARLIGRSGAKLSSGWVSVTITYR